MNKKILIEKLGEEPIKVEKWKNSDNGPCMCFIFSDGFEVNTFPKDKTFGLYINKRYLTTASDLDEVLMWFKRKGDKNVFGSVLETERSIMRKKCENKTIKELEALTDGPLGTWTQEDNNALLFLKEEKVLNLMKKMEKRFKEAGFNHGALEWIYSHLKKVNAYMYRS